jgi:hypothetical protein
MRILTILAVLAAALSLDVRTADAQRKVWPWCAQYDVWTYNCGFDTLQQCLATISGVGGVCRPNSYAPDPATAPQTRKRPRY